MIRKGVLALVAAGLLLAAAPDDASAGRDWYWVVWFSSCFVPCDPILDPGGSEACDCFR